MMKTKQWILVVAMMGVLFATAFAEDNNNLDQRRSDLMKERITFFKENVKPKIDLQRNKLESTINAEDKKEINRLRSEIIKQRLLENEFLFEARAARIKGDDFDEGLWQEIEAQKIVIENLHDQAKLIANKYRPEIDDLVADLREDLREDFNGKGNRGDGDGQGYGRGRRGPGNQDGFNNRGRGFDHGNRGEFGARNHGGFGGIEMRGGMDIVRFLLWDVNRG